MLMGVSIVESDPIELEFQAHRMTLRHNIYNRTHLLNFHKRQYKLHIHFL